MDSEDETKPGVDRKHIKLVHSGDVCSADANKQTTETPPPNRERACFVHDNQRQATHGSPSTDHSTPRENDPIAKPSENADEHRHKH